MTGLLNQRPVAKVLRLKRFILVTLIKDFDVHFYMLSTFITLRDLRSPQ